MADTNIQELKDIISNKDGGAYEKIVTSADDGIYVTCSETDMFIYFTF
jgi:hypothetical protein